MFIDTHAHLFYDGMNVPHIIQDANLNNVSHIFTVGIDYTTSNTCVNIANKHDAVYAITGIHPSEANNYNDSDLDKIKQLANNKKVLAIGEIGLDYHYGDQNKQEQKELLIKQLQLAHELALPVVFHVRDAHDDLIEMLSNHKHLLQNGGVIHCFDQDEKYYNIYKQQFGFKFSIGGVVTYKNATDLQRTVSNMDLSDILIETDTPYLTPMPYRGRRPNQPAYAYFTAEKIAELKQITTLQLSDITNNNVKAVFKKFNN